MSTPQPDTRRELVTRLVEEGGYVAKIAVEPIYEPEDHSGVRTCPPATL